MVPDPPPSYSADDSSDSPDTDSDSAGADDDFNDTTATFDPLTVSPQRAGDGVTVVSRDSDAIAPSEFPAYVAEDGRVVHRFMETVFNATQYRVRKP